MKTCPECDYPNDDGEHRCEKCGIRFELVAAAAVGANPVPYLRAATAENPMDFPVASRAQALPAMRLAQPAWRGEVGQRVRGFRERKGSAQASLQFDPDAQVQSIPDALSTPSNVIRFPGVSPVSSDELPAPVLPPALRAAPAAPPPSPYTAPLSATPPDVAPIPVATWGPPPARRAVSRAAADPAEQQAIPFPQANAAPQTLLDFPVAALELRCLSGAIDVAILGVAFALFCAAGYAAGVRVPLVPAPRMLLLPAAAAIGVLPILYFALFLIYSAATPGMWWTGLRLVDFDGRPATRRQRRKRVWASVSSLASILLGFLWAAVDEEHLTWHDRMSETCLTNAR